MRKLVMAILVLGSSLAYGRETVYIVEKGKAYYLSKSCCKRQEFFVVFLAFSIVVKLAFQNASFLADLITPIH
ncbi:MAG: hypothetical protein ACRCZO_02780 [Cetobacterium sp.]